MPPYLHSEIQEYADEYEDDPITACMHIWTQWSEVTKAINFALMIDAYYTFNYENKGDVNEQK